MRIRGARFDTKRLLDCTLERAGFFNLGINGVQVVGDRNNGEQQKEQTAQQDERMRLAALPGRLSR